MARLNGGKMVATIRLALKAAADLKAKYPEEYAVRRPLVAVSFETGGVRLHEANAGLLAHAEVMDAFQDCRGIVPVVAVVGSKVGCFGGMGFVAAATDVIVMNEEGRIGLTGPEVIEQEMGKDDLTLPTRLWFTGQPALNINISFRIVTILLKIKSVSSIKLWLKWLRYQWLRSKKCAVSVL